MVSQPLLRTCDAYTDLALGSRCLGVCKNWKSVLTGKEAQDFWRVQHYQWGAGGPKHKVSPKSFMRYAFFAGHQVTSFTIDNCKYFGLNNYTLGVVLARCKQLKHLKIRGGRTASTVLDVSSSIPLPALETLYTGLGVIMVPTFLHRLLHASPGIEELSIFVFGSESPMMYRNAWPVLHKLKTIRLANNVESTPVDVVGPAMKKICLFYQKGLSSYWSMIN